MHSTSLYAILGAVSLGFTVSATPVDVAARLALPVDAQLDTRSDDRLAARADPWSNYLNTVVYRPGEGWKDPGTLYGRTVQLPDKSLLATSEVYTGVEPIALPIYRSTDGGITWSNHSIFSDKVNGWGMRFQPNLYVLPVDIGTFKAGTVLAAGNSIPSDFSRAFIDLYASTDNGKTFTFVSHVAYGSGPITTKNGDRAIWEPFLMAYDGKLACFYSSQREPTHGQTLIHKTTKDLRTWSNDVADMVTPYYAGRPGMTTIAYSPKSKKYVMTFENCDAPGNGFCLIHYKVSNSPFSFDRKNWIQLVAKSGEAPSSGPYITWAEDPRRSDGAGLFIVSATSDGAVYVNDDDLYQDNWTRVEIGAISSYTRSLNVVTTPDGRKKLLIGSGGHFGQFSNNAMRVSLIDIPVPP